jgi:hypothetical protein
LWHHYGRYIISRAQAERARAFCLRTGKILADERWPALP